MIDVRNPDTLLNVFENIQNVFPKLSTGSFYLVGIALGIAIGVLLSILIGYIRRYIRNSEDKETDRIVPSQNETRPQRNEVELIVVPNKKTTKNSSMKCLICRHPSNGKHFCASCYSKYKKRSIDVRITECSKAEIIDQYGNLTIECDDGRKVRSRAEALISNFFYNHKIRSVYEKTIYYKENGEDKTLHPDFYLPDYDIYIEYNEITKKSYLESKEYTKKIYEQLGLKVIIMNEKDLNCIAGFLKPILDIN